MLVTLGLLAVAGGAALFRASGPPRAVSAPPAPFGSMSALAPPLHAQSSAGPAHLVVYVAGDVARPGVYDLPPGSRAEAAIRAAGGVRPDADSVAVNLAERLSDGEEIAIPVRGEAPPAFGSTAPGRHARHQRHRRLHGAAQGRRRKAPPEPVDLNAADAAALQTLPGIGPALAERIAEFREANGPFASLDDLLDVAGTSPRLLEEVQPYAVAGGR